MFPETLIKCEAWRFDVAVNLLSLPCGLCLIERLMVCFKVLNEQTCVCVCASISNRRVRVFQSASFVFWMAYFLMCVYVLIRVPVAVIVESFCLSQHFHTLDEGCFLKL